MSELTPIDPALIALMEIHCRIYRQEYGHLRLDGMESLDPIPFPHRQMPGFFTLRCSVEKDLKLWMQMEKTLFDHYEVPMGFKTYMDHFARQPGKATIRSSLLDGMLGAIVPNQPMKDIEGLPVRADLSMSYNFSRPREFVRPQRNVGIGGHSDIHVGIGGRNILGKAFDGLIHSLREMREERRPRLFDDWHMRMVDDDQPPEAEHTTDYRIPRGWKRIPKRIPNPASPSSLLMSLLSRSA
jgi:hypothetical protein